MPRNVRNFWLEAKIDGRQSELSGGPRAKDGGFSLRIYMRSDGDITKPVEIYGTEYNGKLTIRIYHDGDTVADGNNNQVLIESTR